MTDDLGLSVIIITRDEEQDLPLCLGSVKTIASEVVLVDSGSTDKTLDIAKQAHARVFYKEWVGYGAQKQFALDQAKGPWVLNLDADERLSPPLVDEIRRILSQPTAPVVNGFSIPYRNYFMGSRLRFGGTGGERHVRLFKKGATSYGDKKIHEGIRVNPPLGRLNGCIDHQSYSSLQEYLRKCNLYTTLIAEEKVAKGERFHFWHHLRLPFEFFVRFFLKLGILDGGPGFVYATLSAYYAWLKFLKLKDIERNAKVT